MAKSLAGTRIRERRRMLGMRQGALAKAAGISASYLNLIEHNRRNAAGRVLLALAEALDTRFRDAIDLMKACKGRVIVSGIGKSGKCFSSE